MWEPRAPGKAVSYKSSLLIELLCTGEPAEGFGFSKTALILHSALQGGDLGCQEQSWSWKFQSHCQPQARAGGVGICSWRTNGAQFNSSEGNFGTDEIIPIPNKSVWDGPALLLWEMLRDSHLFQVGILIPESCQDKS